MRAGGLTLFFMIIYDFHLIQTEHSASDEICHKPQVFHRVLDEQCNQTNICSMPVNATLRAPVFNQTDIAIITHTMLTSSRLYQDIARLTCKYNINQIEKEDFIEVCKKLGISCSSSSNVATKACRHHRMYILANINDVNCSITKQCSNGIDPFKVDQVQTGKLIV